jgi:hypothetical protein
MCLANAASARLFMCTRLTILATMRLFHLVGLAGLASLVGASPTPVDSRLIMHTNNAFLDPAYEIKAVKNDCVKLPPAVYKNMHSIQMSGKRCSFFKADDCTGDVLLWFNAEKRHARVDIDHYTKYASMTAAVKCEDSATEWTSDTVTAHEDPDALAGHYLVLHTNNQHREPSYKIEASNDVCVKLSPPVYQELHSLEMKGKCCEFFGADTCTGGPILTLTAGSQENRIDMDHFNKYAISTAVVKCMDTGAEEAASVDTAPEKQEASASKRLVVYAEDNFQGVSQEIEATNHCVKLNTSIYKNVHSYGVVDQVCYFMDTDRCNGKVIITANAKGSEAWGHVDVGGTNGEAGRITSVYCGDRAPVESRTVQAPSYNPGVVRACTYAKKRETCQQVNAFESCQNFANNIAEKIDTLKQGGYSECKYWRNKGCSSLIVTSLSGPQDYSPNLGPGNKDGHEMQAVSCKRQSKVNGELGFTIYADEDSTVSKRGGLQSGQVFVADGPNLAGRTRLVDTTTDDNNCAPLTNQFFWHLVSLTQYKGAVCTYWQYNCGETLPNNKPVFTIDSRTADYTLNDLPASFGPNRNKIGYIGCLNANQADAYMATVDSAENNILTSSPLSARAPDVPLNPFRHTRPLPPATWIPKLQPAPNPPRELISPRAPSANAPLFVCHDVDFKGSCFFLSGAGCAQNPFNVDAIESMRLTKGWRCAFYQTVDCQPTKGPPVYWDSKEGEKEFRDVEFAIWSMTCAPFS